MSKPSLQEDLLDVGLKVMFRSGYTCASVRDICEAAGVPLGSFTNHFRSKEAFAEEVLDAILFTSKGWSNRQEDQAAVIGATVTDWLSGQVVRSGSQHRLTA